MGIGDNPFDFINEQLSKVTSRFVPQIGGQETYLFSFTFNDKGNTISLKCNGEDISSTFTSQYISDFAYSPKIKAALMTYYAIPQSQINVEGISSSQGKISFIMEEFELPF